MSDISQLALNEPDQLDWDGYQTAGVGKPIPPAGTYTGVAPEKFEYQAKDGKLVAIIDPIKIVGPSNSGYELRFTRVSTKKYSNRNASPAGDYLKSQGVLSRPGTNQDYVDAIEATANRPFQFDLDWEAYDKEDGWQLSGMENFPDNGTGGRVTYVTNPNTGNKVYARARIRRFRPAV